MSEKDKEKGGMQPCTPLDNLGIEVRRDLSDAIQPDSQPDSRRRPSMSPSMRHLAASSIMAGGLVACHPTQADVGSGVERGSMTRTSDKPNEAGASLDTSTKGILSDGGTAVDAGNADASPEGIPDVPVILGIPDALSMEGMNLVCMSDGGRIIDCDVFEGRISFDAPLGKRLEYAIIPQGGGDRLCGFFLEANAPSSGAHRLECQDELEFVTVNE